MEGEAVIEVSRRQRLVWLDSDAGVIILQAGRYAVRCEADGTFLISVARGVASLSIPLKTRPPGYRALQITAGQFGRLAPGVLPERTNGAGYPIVPDTL